MWLDEFRRGDRHADNLQLEGGVTFQSFLETQTNSLAGWSGDHQHHRTKRNNDRWPLLNSHGSRRC